MFPDSWRIEVGPVSGGVSIGGEDRELLARLARYFGAEAPVPATEPSRLTVHRRPGPSGSEGAPLYELRGLARDPRQSTSDFGTFVERLDSSVDEIVGASTERDYLVLHASAVAEPGRRALVFVGRSMAGKSTTAALFALAGSALYGDECLALRPAGEPHVLRWRRPLSLREDVLELVGEAAAWGAAERDEILVTERKRLIPSAQLAPGEVRESVPVGAFVWLDPSASQDGLAETGGLFRELLAACHYFQRDGHELFGMLAALARQTPAFRVRPGPRVIERVRGLVS